jgi:hypothetical protein
VSKKPSYIGLNELEIQDGIDGGPAFPIKDSRGDIYLGISARDYFAAKAMQALIPSGQSIDSMKYAESAYALADAMLKARDEQ